MVSARTPYAQTAIAGYDSGMTDFLAKPFNREVLRRKVLVAMEAKAEAKKAYARLQVLPHKLEGKVDAGPGASILLLAKDATARIKSEREKSEELRRALERTEKQVAELKGQEGAAARRIAETGERAAKAEAEATRLKKQLDQLEQQYQQQCQQQQQQQQQRRPRRTHAYVAAEEPR